MQNESSVQVSPYLSLSTNIGVGVWAFCGKYEMKIKKVNEM